MPVFVSGAVGYKWYKKLNTLMQAANEDAAKCEGVDPETTLPFHTSTAWANIYTEIVAVNGLTFSLVLVCFCVFLALLACSRNVRMSIIIFLAVVWVLFVNVSFFLFWDGKLASCKLSLSILMGFSVDYPLHVCEAYLSILKEGSRTARRGCTRHQATSGGYRMVSGTIFHAGMTTLLSVSTLFMCTVVVLKEAATVIVVSVAVSLVVSYSILGSVLLTFGPQRVKKLSTARGDQVAPDDFSPSSDDEDGSSESEDAHASQSSKRAAIVAMKETGRLIAFAVAVLGVVVTLDKSGLYSLRLPSGEPAVSLLPFF